MSGWRRSGRRGDAKTASAICNVSRAQLRGDGQLFQLTAPCGGLRLVHPDSDVGIARAAAAFGTVDIASSVSGHTLEEIAAATSAPKWFQLYKLGGRAGLERLVELAAAHIQTTPLTQTSDTSPLT